MTTSPSEVVVPAWLDDAPWANDGELPRPLPSNVRVETELLGNLLWPGGGSRMPEVVGKLTARDFSSRTHSVIYEACLRVHGAGHVPTVGTVAEDLETAGTLRILPGGERLLRDLVGQTSVLIPKLLGQHVDVILERRRARDLLLETQRVAAQLRAGDDSGPVLAALRETVARLETVATTRTFPVLGGPEIAATLPSVDYLVPELGLVAGGGAPHLLAGYGFSGKTLAAQALGLALVAGRPVWAAYPPTRLPDGRRHRVLHVDFEQGERLTRRRYQRLAVAMGADLAGLGDGLGLVVMPDLTLTEGCATRWAELMAGRDLVIIDSLRAASAGLDENSSEIRAGLDMLGHVSEQTGCRPLVILHARKPSDDAPAGRYAIRGSSAIYDAADSAYLFAAAKGEPVSVEHVKARSHGDLVEDFALVISDAEADGDPRGGLSVEVRGMELVRERRERASRAAVDAQVKTDAEVVKRTLGASPGLGTRDLRSVSRLSGDRLARAIEHLRGSVEVREERSSKGPATRRHYLLNGSA